MTREQNRKAKGQTRVLCFFMNIPAFRLGIHLADPDTVMDRID